ELARGALHRLERGRKRRERPLVRRELDYPLEPELALHVLHRLPRLVRRQPLHRRPKELLGRAHPAILEPPRAPTPGARHPHESVTASPQATRKTASMRG